MTPGQWARVLRAGRNRLVNWPAETPPVVLAMQALDAMANEADQVAREQA